ncbi:MAG: ATP synthase F1 subunit delta [Lachnospiraceae bacterium]|nr:ATP synthase F1 subunit delta [Lachnospiraceae bacterium]
MAGVVSNTYGHALFEIAVSEGAVDRYLEEAQTVLTVLAENPDVLKLYEHPKITPEEKQDFTEKCFGGRVSNNMTGFLVLAVRNGREKELPRMLREMIREAKEYKGIGIVSVTTPTPLTAEQRVRVERKILATTGYRTLETEYTIDPALIGGIVIRIGDRVLDASISTQLQGLKKELLQVQIGL